MAKYILNIFYCQKQSQIIKVFRLERFRQAFFETNYKNLDLESYLNVG